MSTPLNIAKSGHPKLKKLRQRLEMNAKDDVKGNGHVDEPAEVPKVGRKNELFNRSSPMKLVRLSKSFNHSQRGLITKYGFGSFVYTKISKLHPELCKHLMDSFNPDSCELRFNGRGSLPITEEVVHRVLQIPMGKNPVKYCIDTEATKLVFDMLQIKDGKHPKLSDLENKLSNTQAADESFMRLWLLHAMSSMMAPTTGTMVSPRCYPAILDIQGISDLSWCRFIVDVLIKTARAKDKNMFKACMPFLMIFTSTRWTSNQLNLKRRGLFAYVFGPTSWSEWQ